MATVTKSPTDATSAIKEHINSVIGEYKASNKAEVDALKAELNEIKQKALTPVYPQGVSPAWLNTPHVTAGPVGRDSDGYSILKAVAFANGMMDAELCKEEINVGERLKALYDKHGYTATRVPNTRTFLVPYSTAHMPQFTGEGVKLASELRQKQMASVRGFDPDEAAWVRRKALGTTSDTSGASLIGYPELGELIDMQRKQEVFTQAGAKEITLPGNAMIDFPKLMNGATAYWVGEGKQITQSQETTGSLKLVGKKLATFVPLNNELLRYANPTAEGMVRADMAAVNALAIDLAMLEGTGGTQPKGLITYDSSSSWTVGEDKLLTYSVTSNTFQPQDVYGMIGVLPDPVQKRPLKFIMRNDLWGKVRGRRASAITANDGAGQFVFNVTRTVSENIPAQLDGYPVVASSQVSKTRGSGSQTYVLAGAFEDWVIGRFGVMEFLASNTGDTPMAYDQTLLRAIQIMDAGARHASSFCFADAITIQ